MNKIKNIVFTFIALVLVQFVALAQDGAGDFGGNAEDNPLDTPIDSFVWLLLVVGLVYAFYKYSSLKLKEERVS